jgi:hypothetical protein
MPADILVAANRELGWPAERGKVLAVRTAEANSHRRRLPGLGVNDADVNVERLAHW